jgi:hypothetical protein
MPFHQVLLAAAEVLLIGALLRIVPGPADLRAARE